MIDIDIRELIPHREPILMVDRLVNVGRNSAETIYRVKSDHFLLEDETLGEVALIEHIAQSAAAFAGYKAKKAGETHPSVGYIGEIKNFHYDRCPYIGEVLRTNVIFELEIGNLSVVNGVTCVDGRKIAEAQLKIVIKPNE